MDLFTILTIMLIIIFVVLLTLPPYLHLISREWHRGKAEAVVNVITMMLQLLAKTIKQETEKERQDDKEK